MSELKELMTDINKLRDTLYRIIEQQGYDLNDPEVIEASKDLNIAITNYNKLIKNRIT